MIGSVQGAVPIACLASAALGLASGRVRRFGPGFVLALVTPVVAAYFLAFLTMITLVHPHPPPPGGWVYVATAYWAAWGVPTALVTYACARWIRATRRRNIG